MSSINNQYFPKGSLDKISNLFEHKEKKNFERDLKFERDYFDWDQSHAHSNVVPRKIGKPRKVNDLVRIWVPKFGPEIGIVTKAEAVRDRYEVLAAGQLIVASSHRLVDVCEDCLEPSEPDFNTLLNDLREFSEQLYQKKNLPAEASDVYSPYIPMMRKIKIKY